MVEKGFHEQRNAAGFKHILGHILAAWFQVGNVGRALENFSDIKEIKTDLRIILGIAIGTYLVIGSCYLLLADKIEKQADRIERVISAKQASKQ